MKKICAPLTVFLLIAANALAAPDTNETCVMTAFKEFNDANTALLLHSGSPMPIEATLAQRRLQEDYCGKQAHCVTDALPAQERSMVLDSAFSDCLEQEAKEKYELK